MKIRPMQITVFASLALCLFLSAPAFAAAPNGLDTPSGVPTLPLSVEGNTVEQLNSDMSATFAGPATFAGTVKVGGANTDCAGNAGAIRWNGTAFQGCNGTTWTSLGGFSLVATESLSCNEGNGAAGGNACARVGGTGGTSDYHITTASTHQLCVLAAASGWAGGLWGACGVSGTPGGTWTLDTAVYHNQVNCSMQCYDPPS